MECLHPYPLLGYLTEQLCSSNCKQTDQPKENRTCLEKIEKFKKILDHLKRTQFRSAEEGNALRLNIETLERAIRQSQKAYLQPAFRALNHFVCALRGRVISNPEYPPIALFGSGELAKKGPHTYPLFKPQIVSLPAQFADKGIAAWISLAHVVGHDILEAPWLFYDETLLEKLRKMCRKIVFDEDQIEMRDQFLDRFSEIAADLMSVWLLGRSAGIGFISYMRSKAPWFCVDSVPQSCRGYIFAAAIEVLLKDQDASDWLLDQTSENGHEHSATKAVAYKFVVSMASVLNHLPFAQKVWGEEDESVVAVYVEAFKVAGHTGLLADAINWKHIDPLHKVAAAFLASLELSYVVDTSLEQSNPEPSSQLSEEKMRVRYVQNIFDAMIASLQ